MVALALGIVAAAIVSALAYVRRRQAKPKPDRVINSKVAGVTMTNPDGSRRQEIIRSRAFAGSGLELRPEPFNPVDPGAIAVHLASNAGQIGYLNARLAKDVGRMRAEGCTVKAKITAVTGDDQGESTGVNIELSVWERDEGAAE